MKMYQKLTISNILILISGIFTLLVILIPELNIFWINNLFIGKGLFYIYFIQIFTWTFIHWWIFHFFVNSLFLYLFWNILELLIWKNKFIIFFIFTTIFIWLMLLFNLEWTTVWISGFCMALLSYYTLELKSRNNPEYKWWITALIINIWIWILPWISLYWHLFWAIAWVIFYLITKEFLRRRMVGLVEL
jgi:hypothetical protein